MNSDTAQRTETIFPEVKAAAAWWADHLAHPSRQNNGDLFQSDFATALMLSVLMQAAMTANEKTSFTEALEAALQAHVLRYDWHHADPTWGSSNRCVGVDYHPEPVLAEALVIAVGQARAHQLSLLWPIKTRMWIDRGCVKVTHGYRAEPQVIYPAESTQDVKREAS